MKHILNTSNTARNTSTICGLIGSTVYNPIEADCKSCIEIFKERYPGSYDQWLSKTNQTKTPKSKTGVEDEVK